MSLKILIVPFAIIMMLVLTIGFIKPDIGVMEEKKLTLSTKQDQSANMTTLLGNIATLARDLDNRQESEKFVNTYLPKSLDQERVIDMLNYLAGQSGVSMAGVIFKDVSVKSFEAETLVAADGSELPSSHAPKIKTFSTEVSVNGNYENIKDFFNRVAHMNRSHKTESFAIKAVKETTGKGEPTTTLQGMLVANFDYFPVQKVGSALLMPIFSRGELDITQLTKTLSWVTATVPPLASSATGRPNPFQ